MYEHFEGVLMRCVGGRATIDVGGIGYQLLVSSATAAALPPTGNRARLLAHLVVTDGEPRLFGFATSPEREAFRLLIGVSGVGPSTALAVLSALPLPSLARALSEGDETVLRSVKGIGAKTASRLVVDLRDAIRSLGLEPTRSDAMRDASDALLSLGFSRAEVERHLTDASRKVGTDDREALIKTALAASRGA